MRRRRWRRRGRCKRELQWPARVKYLLFDLLQKKFANLWINTIKKNSVSLPGKWGITYLFNRNVPESHGAVVDWEEKLGWEDVKGFALDKPTLFIERPLACGERWGLRREARLPLSHWMSQGKSLSLSGGWFSSIHGEFGQHLSSWITFSGSGAPSSGIFPDFPRRPLLCSLSIWSTWG